MFNFCLYLVRLFFPLSLPFLLYLLPSPYPLHLYPSQIKVLNDSNEIVVSLYLSSFILVVVITISILYGEYLNVYTAAYAIGITLSSLVVLGVVFISKVIMQILSYPTPNNYSPPPLTPSQPTIFIPFLPSPLPNPPTPPPLPPSLHCMILCRWCGCTKIPQALSF